MAPGLIIDAAVMGGFFLGASPSSPRSTPAATFSAGALSMRFGLFSNLMSVSTLARLACTPSRCFSAAFLNGAEEEEEEEAASLSSFGFLEGPKGTRSSSGLLAGFVGVGTSTTRFALVFFTATLVFLAAAVAAAATVVVAVVPMEDPPAFDDVEAEGLKPMGVIVGSGGSSAAVVKTSSS